MAKRKDPGVNGSWLTPVESIPSASRGGDGRWAMIAAEAAARPRGTFEVDLDGANAKTANACLRRIVKIHEYPLTVAMRTVDGEAHLYITVNKK